MGSTLASREDGVINALLEIFCILKILPEEDETSTRTTKSLVTAKIMLNAVILCRKSGKHT